MQSSEDLEAIDSDNELESEQLSKTERKKRSTELQHLGLELSRLSASELDRLDLDPELRKALDEANKIKPGGAHRRQIKFIGGLLRERDAEPVREKFLRLKHRSDAAARVHHRLERWRTRLITEGDRALDELVEQVPAIDRRQLRQLVRNASREIEQGKGPRATRVLYRYLRTYFD